MKPTKKKTGNRLTDKQIDDFVASQADDDSAWETPVKVRRGKSQTLSVPAELAVRAAFLAKLHKADSVEKWLTKVIEERVELEEVAFNEAKREILGSR